MTSIYVCVCAGACIDVCVGISTIDSSVVSINIGVGIITSAIYSTSAIRVTIRIY